MDESEDNMSSDSSKKNYSKLAIKVKPKKRSLVERELETNLTPKATSPLTIADGTKISRYGRARRMKTDTEVGDSLKGMSEVLKNTQTDKSPVKVQSPVYKMHASNSPIRMGSPKKAPVEAFLENQIENIYHENISLSRFTAGEMAKTSPSKNSQKVYTQKDLIQNREPDETLVLIKNMYSPIKSTHRAKSTHLSNILERSSDKFNLNTEDNSQNGFIDNSSVVKTLDFDSKKKKKETKLMAKSDLFELEAKCVYQVGDLAWARMGTYPFWPCIITRDPGGGIFVKKKLFGRIERDIIHVTFFGDNGRRGWIVDNMLRKFKGLAEFEATREKFNPEDKKKDPRYYAAFFVSDKKQVLWHTSVEEAETLLKEPKRLRIDLLNDMLENYRPIKTTPKILKSGKVTRTDSDVSLSESLYDTLFSEDDGKIDDSERSKNKSKNKSLDVSEVVTACLDNMAAKTGITKIQRQSHMDRWLQKAKSKTPEKTQLKITNPKKVTEHKLSYIKKKSHRNTIMHYSLRKSSSESQNLLAHQNEHDYSKFVSDDDNSSIKTNISDGITENKYEYVPLYESGAGEDVVAKIESLVNTGEKSNLNKSVNIVICEEVPKKVVNENGVTVLDNIEIQNLNKAQLSNISETQEVSVGINNEKEHLGDNAISSNSETIISNTTYNQEEDTSYSSISLDVSEIQGDSKNLETINEIAIELNNCNNNVTNNAMVNDNERVNLSSINESKDRVAVQELSLREINYENLDVLTNNQNISPEWSVREGAKSNDVKKEGFNNSLSTDTVNTKKSAEENGGDNLDPDINLFSKSKCDEVNFIIEDISLHQFESTFLHSIKSPHEDNLEVPNTIHASTSSNKTNIRHLSSTPLPETNAYKTNINDNNVLNHKENLKYEFPDETIVISDSIKKKSQKVKDLDEMSSKHCTISHQESSATENINNNHQKTNNECKYNKESTLNVYNTINTSNNSGASESGKGLVQECHENITKKSELVNYDKVDVVIAAKKNISAKQKNIKCMNEVKKIEDESENVITNLNNSHVSANGETLVQECFQKLSRENKLRNFGSLDVEICANEDSSVKHKDNNFMEALKGNLDECHDIINTLNISNVNDCSKELVSKSHENITTNNILVNSDTTAKEDTSSKQKDVSSMEELKRSNNECQNINGFYEANLESPVKIDNNVDITLENYEVCEISNTKEKYELFNKRQANKLDDPEFLKYFHLREDIIRDEYPELSDDEIRTYLYQTWFYEVSRRPEIQKSDYMEHETLVKGMDKPVPKKNFRRMKDLASRKGTKNRLITEVKDNTDSDSESESSQTSVKSNTNLKSPVALAKRNLSLIRLSKGVSLSPVKEISDALKNNDVVNISESNEKSDNRKMEIKHTENTRFPAVHNASQMSTEIISRNSTISDEHVEDDNLAIKELNVVPNSESNVQEREHNVNVNEYTNEKNEEFDVETASINSEASDVPLIYQKLRFRPKQHSSQSSTNLDTSKEESESNNESFNSEDSGPVTPKTKQKNKNETKVSRDNSEFHKYCELRQDILIEENPQLTEEDIRDYLYKTWIYEQNSKSDLKKVDEVAVKGLEEKTMPPKKVVKKKVQVNKEITDYFEISPRTKRKLIRPLYNEDYYSDIEDDIVSFEVHSDKHEKQAEETFLKTTDKKNETTVGSNEEEVDDNDEIEDLDEAEVYFSALLKPKPNIFKGLLREKVCEICEKTVNLVKCKSCHGMFHIDCVQSESKVVEVSTPHRGRKRKKKSGRKPKNPEDPEGTSDDKQDISEDINISLEEIETESITVDAEILEKQLFEKMKELLENADPVTYDSCFSDNEYCDDNWTDTVAGRCEIVNVKMKRKSIDDYLDFKCNNCLKHGTPICFVCRSAVSKNDSKIRQRCNIPHCNKYYHLECLDHWPQTQFNSCESKNSRKVNEHSEALSCPRHVCHTCVSDDPRGCKTRFSGDKLARCVRCPATYHSFTKCVPAGSQILTASHIICPRHYQHRPGKVPCHVNTGWCFICALGGSLICCEYCPTSFHAECLNIDPPEGGYMCEDCETGRLPLYGEMVWVKLGHYRWWPGLILHPSEVPRNIMAVKHSQGEFVVRFFGQYDYYWVNRGRVFPFQEGDSGRISSQKSKIDAAFTMAIEHAQRACEILKSAQPNDEESLDIAQSLLPPHYVKLKVNKPCGSLCGRKLDDPELSLTQCECNPDEEDPCGPYSQCLNRMLLTECGPSCRAGERCNNRAFEKRLYPKLVPYRTPHRGWGLKTLEDIKAGQFVIEYVGELIDEEEFKRRMRRKHEVRDENFYFLTLDKERMIDAGPKGNLARFMNHCCEPNCETQKWTVLGDVRVGLFALYDIPANSEVTFNYNLESTGIEKKRCLCGAKRCSGYIGAKPKQDESQLKKGKVKRAYKKRKVEESPSTSKIKRKQGRPPKPKELSEIEKDLLIIRNATCGLSSDESSRSFSSEGDRLPRALKRKRVDFSTEEVAFNLPDISGSKKQRSLEKEDSVKETF